MIPTSSQQPGIHREDLGEDGEDDGLESHYDRGAAVDQRVHAEAHAADGPGTG